jgi:hypothetical protein
LKPALTGVYVFPPFGPALVKVLYATAGLFCYSPELDRLEGR